MFEKPLGGTELMFNELVKRVPKDLFDKYSVFNYASNADPSKTMIYWNQLSYDQEAIQFLQYKENVDKINHFVFVSNWQAEQFRKMFNIPGHKTHVLRNAHLGVSKKEITKKEKLKICYTSTPWRGLDVLLLAWEILNPQNCELHVFSSCKIYGTDFAKEDTKYEFLYDWCKRLPNVVYRGSIPNEELRNELSDFDILAYPSTFEETSCISVIEALATGLRVITSSIGALPETTEGWAKMYSYIEDREEHGRLFSKILGEEIERMFNGELVEQLTLQRDVYSKRWSWEQRIKDWEYFFKSIEPVKKESKLNLISKYFQPQSVLDIGANIGQFYNECKESFPDSKYHLIEGNSICESELKKLEVDYTIALLSNDVKEVDFWMRTDDPFATGNSIYKENTEFYNSSISIKKWTKTLDNLFQNESFDLIKIDTQGSEIDILNGGQNLIKSAKGIILEVSYKEYNIGSLLSNDVIEYMTSIGFSKVEVINSINHPITGEHIQDDVLFVKNNLL
jgi:FkbM family methyltransferase